ncbi:MAG: ABC transporter permease subunit [Bacillota bacterium]|nr:ABC transporter permease subunit [Bacillota bacterium]
MNIFLHELKSYRKSTIIWSCSMAAVIIIFLSIFPSLVKDAAEYKKLLQSYPEPVRKAFGLSIDSIFSFLGYYSYVFPYIILCGSIQSMNYGTSVLSKEVRDKTADFLLTKPVTRIQIMTAKILAVLSSLIITNILYLISAIIMALIVKNSTLNYKVFFMITLSGFFVELMFLALGIIISVIVPKIKSVLPISISTVFSFYIVSMFGSVIGDKVIRYITPFKYYDTAYIIKNSAYESRFIIIEAIFIISVIFAGYKIYVKKDIHAV